MSLAETRLAFILNDAAPKALFAQADALNTLQLSFPDASTLLLNYEAGATDFVAHQSGPEDIAYLIYTSGSTGQPKGVLAPHRGSRLDAGRDSGSAS